MQLDNDPTGEALDELDNRTKDVQPNDAVTDEIAMLSDAYDRQAFYISNRYLGFCNDLANDHAYPREVPYTDNLTIHLNGDNWKVLRVCYDGSVLISLRAEELDLNMADFLPYSQFERNTNGLVEHVGRDELEPDEQLAIMMHLSQHGYDTVEGDEGDNQSFYFGSGDID